MTTASRAVAAPTPTGRHLVAVSCREAPHAAHPAAPHHGAPPLLGRDRERKLLDRVVAEVRAGESRTVLLSGDAGIGKTALLDHLAGQVEGWRVIRAAGVEPEKELAFAALHQVCAPVLDELTCLPAPQQETLTVAFGRRAGSPPDRFMAGLAVLGLLAEAAREQPLLCLIDDAQWLDRESAQVLGFAARRLRSESVAMIFAVRRNGERAAVPELAGLFEVNVTGLPDEDARTLLAVAHPGRVDNRVRDRIIAESRGNPLALLELPRGLSADELAGGFGLHDSSTAPARIEEGFRRQIATLPSTARQLLLVAAAEPVGDPVLVRRAIDHLGIVADTGPTSSGIIGGLVEFGSRVTFRHPLLRSAIYRAAHPEDRRKAHWALARGTDPVADPDRLSWHRAQAADRPNEAIAAELEHSAERAQARGGLTAAAAFLERAAELTPDTAGRGRRLLAGAWARYQAGMTDAALLLLAQAEAGELGEFERAKARLLRARIAFTVHHGRDAAPLLLGAAVRLQPLDSRLARDTYLDVLGAARYAADASSDAVLQAVTAASGATPVQEGPPRPQDLLLAGSTSRYTAGYAAGTPILRQALGACPSPDLADAEGLRWLCFAGTTAMDLCDDEAADSLTSGCVRRARDIGALAVLALALPPRIVLEIFAGNLASAAALVAELRAVGGATGIPVLPYPSQLLTAWQGREEGIAAPTAATTAEADRRGEEIGAITAGWALAILHNSLGDFEQAFVAAQRATAPAHEMGVLTWSPLLELITAAVRTGRRGVAADALERLAELAQANGTDWALGMEASSRALVSEGRRAEGSYLEAIERLSRTRIRGENARAHLHYGEWLRRQGRSDDAGHQLRIAHDMFTAMGMATFAASAARELIAIGRPVPQRGDSGAGRLTAQEAQVACLARDGLSNAEIGARLFISPRTVEWHLGNIFAKLGITSRRQLRAETVTPVGGRASPPASVNRPHLPGRITAPLWEALPPTEVAP